MKLAARYAVISVLIFAGCSSSKPAAETAPTGEAVSAKDSPMSFKVLLDQTIRDENRVEFHVLVDKTPTHDEADGLLKYLYRHLKTRDPEPGSIGGYVYTSEVQFNTPPRTPLASVVQKPSDVGPVFENKVPLEFWQEIDQALPHTDKGWKLEKKIERHDADRSFTLTYPYVEAGKDQWADSLSFNIAVNEFTDVAKTVFENVPDLKAMTFIGRYKDQDVVKITLDRPTYQALNVSDIEEQVGQLHGTAFLKGSTGHGTDASINKELQQKRAALYKKMLGQITPKPFIAASLK